MRTLAYEIDHKTTPSTTCSSSTAPRRCSSELDRTLRITDGVVRFRIIKLAPGTPAAAGAARRARAGAGRRGAPPRGPREPRPASASRAAAARARASRPPPHRHRAHVSRPLRDFPQMRDRLLAGPALDSPTS